MCLQLNCTFWFLFFYTIYKHLSSTWIELELNWACSWLWILHVWCRYLPKKSYLFRQCSASYIWMAVIAVLSCLLCHGSWGAKRVRRQMEKPSAQSLLLGLKSRTNHVSVSTTAHLSRLIIKAAPIDLLLFVWHNGDVILRSHTGEVGLLCLCLFTATVSLVLL